MPYFTKLSATRIHLLFSAMIPLLVFAVPIRASADKKQAPPNIIVIFCDNLGYGDIGCFGSTKHRTPHVDQLAKEGMRFTSFYVSAGVCTPSRASLMTGCYPRRIGLDHTPRDGWVLRPISQNGLNPDEVTIAEVLKARGYATAIVGKWHLGDQPAFLPTRQGFDSYFGIPYSDDMTPIKNGTTRQGWPPLPLMRDEKVIEAPVDRNTLTQRYTAEAIKFVEANRTKPFFLYLPHAMPGSTSKPFASEAFRGKSKNGPYGDSVEELDWSTGQIMSALKKLKIDDNTLIVWTSDNGAPRRRPVQGSAGPLKGFGYDTSEGAMRVCCVMRWPGRVPAGTTCDELASTMDLLPTFAKLGGVGIAEGNEPPSELRPIDGKDISELMLGKEGAKSPHEAFFYYHNRQLQAVRDKQYKLYLALDNKLVGGGNKTAKSEAALFDLKSDIGEKKNIAAAKPDIVARLSSYADNARADLGDWNKPGKGQRAAGHVADPTPRVME